MVIPVFPMMMIRTAGLEVPPPCSAPQPSSPSPPLGPCLPSWGSDTATIGGWLAGWLVGWLVVGCLVAWLDDWMVGWLVGWLIG